MKDDKKLDKTLERFFNRFNGFNTEVLEILGNVVKQFDGLTEEQAHALAQELRMGYDLEKLKNDLARITGKSIKDIDILLDEVAKENVDFSEVYQRAKNGEFISYADNEPLQRIVESIKKQTNDTFLNLSQTQNIGFSLKDNKGNITFKPLTKVYNELIDKAVYNVSIGTVDYQTAMRKTIRGLADSGVKIHEEKLAYASGYNRRIDSSVRQNVLTGLRQVNIGVQEEIGDMLGSDGVEISAHFPCAEDHLPIQGKQFSKEKFEKLNNSLDRPIGEYNCRHFVFSVILGVQEPSHTNAMLEHFRQESLAKVEFEGKTYTKYQATQVQRKIETAIRRQKDRNIIANASGNEKEALKTQEKINQLTNKYKDFSNKADLKTYKNRLKVVGYDD